MAKRKISDYLPEKAPAAVNFLQARVPKALYQQTKTKMKLAGHTWDELVEACFRHYCEEEK